MKGNFHFMSNKSNNDSGCEILFMFIIAGFLALLYFILTHLSFFLFFIFDGLYNEVRHLKK